MLQLDQHWRSSRVDARFDEGWQRIDIQTNNVARFEIRVSAAQAKSVQPQGFHQSVAIAIDGQEPTPHSTSRRWRSARDSCKTQGRWQFDTTEPQASTPAKTLVKAPGLQGPIDDAFYSRFLIVRPSGTAKHASIHQWTERELQHALRHWRLQFRGEAGSHGIAMSHPEMRESNLICFGTPESNSIIARRSRPNAARMVPPNFDYRYANLRRQFPRFRFLFIPTPGPGSLRRLQ